MTLMPSNIVTFARAALFVLTPGVAVLCLAPGQPLQALPISESAAQAALFYGITATAFVAFPRLRRSDMAATALVLAGVIELIQLASGQAASLRDWLSAGIGISALYVPSLVEQMRHMARKHAFSTFSDLAANDRRKRARRKPVVAESAVDRFSPQA